MAKVMAIGIASPEGGAVPGAQYLFADVGDQRQLTIQHPDELVFVTVPVTLAGPVAGRQPHQVDAEIDQAAGIAEPLPHTIPARRRKPGRIA